MRILLAYLMCMVLFESQCFALKGGPVYGGGTNIVGAYAGVLSPTNTLNTLGIFSLGIPQTGLARGSLVIFTGRRTFSGTIQGVGDPNKATLRAALQAIPIVTVGDNTETTIGLHADGFLNARITSSRNSIMGVSSSLLVGTAEVTTSVTGDPTSAMTANFLVDGFKQSDSAPSSSG